MIKVRALANIKELVELVQDQTRLLNTKDPQPTKKVEDVLPELTQTWMIKPFKAKVKMKA